MNALPVFPAGAAAPAPLTAAVVKAAVVAALGGLLFGFDTAVISGAETALREQFGLNSRWYGFTVAIALVGTVFGSLAVGKLADLFGRRKVLFGLAVAYFASAIGCGLAPDWYTFMVFRFLGGLAIGGSSVVAPLYIAEIAPPAWRGRLVALSQFKLVLGILVSFASNYVIAASVNDAVAWRWMLGVAAAPSLVFFLLICTITESPRWLVAKGRIAEARAVLQKIGVADVAGELAAISASLVSLAGASSERLFQPRYGRMIFLAWAVAMFNQLSGINALMYYLTSIFEMAGATRETALLYSVAVGGTNLLFTAAAMLVIDRVGRRPLLLVGSLGTAASLAVVAFEFAKPDGARSGTTVLAALLTFIAFFAFSQGAVIWVFISEVFPNAVRAKGQALGSFTHWFMATAISQIFPEVAEWSGASAFVFFAAMMGVQFLFALLVMPETKGGAIEDIEKRFGRGASA